MSFEEKYKEIAGFFSNFLNTLLSLFKIILRSKPRIVLPKAPTRTCYLLGNGPSLKGSLKKAPLLFSQNTLFCVNTFAITEEYSSLKPQFYVLLDPFFWEQKNETTEDTFKALKEKTTWEMYLLIPQTASHQPIFEELRKANGNIKISVFNYTVFKGFPQVAHYFYRKNLAMPQSMNVVIATLFLAVNAGFKEVILVGADHNWHENLHMSDQNILHTKSVHFYENEAQVRYIPYHKASDKNRPTNKAHEFFDIWSRTFFAYHLIENYAKKSGCKIYNSSETSFIDAFERKKI